MKRKLLFVLFADDACRQNHAFMYAVDLHRRGHEVRLILEGQATQCVRRLEDPESKFAKLFREANESGLIVGACQRASNGCSSNDEDRRVVDLVQGLRLQLLDDLTGHAGIERFVEAGYEIVVI